MTTRSMKVRLGMVAAIGASVVALVASPAFAGGKQGAGSGGKTGGSGGGSLSVVMVNDLNGNGGPNYGDTITFNVTSTASQPYVVLTCYQNGTEVYTHQAGFYAGYPWSDNYVLSSSFWSGGAAACTATLEYNSNKSTVVQASITVNVGA